MSNFTILKINNDSSELDKFNINEFTFEELVEILNEYLKNYNTSVDNDYYFDETNGVTYLYPLEDIGFYFKVLLV